MEGAFSRQTLLQHSNTTDAGLHGAWWATTATRAGNLLLPPHVLSGVTIGFDSGQVGDSAHNSLLLYQAVTAPALDTPLSLLVWITTHRHSPSFTSTLSLSCLCRAWVIVDVPCYGWGNHAQRRHGAEGKKAPLILTRRAGV